MRLLKLLAYSLFGYVVYELYLGMTEGAEMRSSQSTAQRLGHGRQDAGATTGGSTGSRSVKVQDPNGARATRSVGSGVVH
jgi:hypothetical protein